MKHPPEKILETALRLFNERGLAQVTLRTLAQEMGISQGNLTYHFRKREEIVEGLYRQMVAEMDAVVAGFQGQVPDMQMMFFSVQKTMDIFYKYRFLMLDFVQVMRAHASIRVHYAGLQVMRTQQFAAIFGVLRQAGLMRNEEFAGEFDSLYHRLQILGDFWLSTAVIANGERSLSSYAPYFRVLSEAIYPYLTEAGKQAFLAMRPLFSESA